MSPIDGESADFWRCVSDDKDKRLAELASDLSSAREEIAAFREAAVQMVKIEDDIAHYSGTPIGSHLMAWGPVLEIARKIGREALRSSRTKGEAP